MTVPVFVRWMQIAWSWRNYHPTASCVVTGLWGALGLIAGIVSATGPAGGGGLFFSLIGVVLLGLVLYAAYDTNWFQDWKVNATGTAIEGHSVARAIGPLSLSAAVLSTVVFVGVMYLTTLVISIVAKSA